MTAVVVSRTSSQNVSKNHVRWIKIPGRSLHIDVSGFLKKSLGTVMERKTVRK